MPIKYINILAFALMVFVNYLANALPINGKTTGQISAAYPNLFAPAGITFSIWGIIYLMLMVFVLLQFREENKQMIAALGWLFALSCVLNATWIFAWHYDRMFWSLILMLALLATLVVINQKLMPFPAGLSRAVFGIYLGWICIATIANVTVLLVKYQWGGWGIPDEVWTIVMIAAGCLITAAVVYKLENPFAGLAVIWAFTGIILKRQQDVPSIVIAAGIAIAVSLLMVIISFSRQLFPTA
ncbi:MAG: TspO/MBR family protein [Bacteroidales bacterium]|nr:TspO/MBR family protein [Bacteroidales bacterium]